MKTVLMIAPYFVPRRRVGSLRPYKFASHLPSFGWKPVVYTIGSSGDELTPGEKNALKEVTVNEINPPFDRTTREKQGKAYENAEPDHRIWAEWSDWFAEWFDRQVPMDTWIFLFWSAYSKILKQAKILAPDLVWSTGDPWSGHWLGSKLSKDLELPWIADFRDPWTLSGLSLRERSFISNRADQKLEKKFIQSADKLIFTAKSTEELYVNHYSLSSEKADTIYNSYNTPPNNTEKENKVAPVWSATVDDSKLNILFFGSFRRLSPITPIAEAVAALPAEYKNKIRVHSFGELMEEDAHTLERLNISDLFLVHKKVVPEQAPSVFKKADILLVSTSRERESIIPAKLWEYLISDKPILSITPNPEIGDILKKTGAGIHYHNRQTGEIAEALKLAADQKEKGNDLFDINRKPDVIESYSAKNNTRKLAQIMDTIAGDEQ